MLIAETREHLQQIVNEFVRTCDSIGLKIDVGKSKVLVVKKDQRESNEKVRVSWEEMQEVEKFNYLGVIISTECVKCIQSLGRSSSVVRRYICNIGLLHSEPFMDRCSRAWNLISRGGNHAVIAPHLDL